MSLIKKAAVLGGGVMGSQIAAHLANSGIPTLLLDIPSTEPTKEELAKGLTGESPQVRSRVAERGLEAAKKLKPAPFSEKWRVSMVTIGNLDDDLEKLREVDWVVEAVIERMDIKAQLLEKVAAHLPEHCLITTNTSGLSVNEMSSHLPESVRPRFFGTHFFNPPRYMHLLEIIPSETSDDDVVTGFCRFAEERLGKGIVYAKDTPNFIANRVGVFSMLYTIEAMTRHGLTVAEVDGLTGKVIGRPGSATFRTADLVGLDVLAHVAKTQYDGAPDDEKRDIFELPGWLTSMVEKGLLGQKSGGGFFKKATVDGEKTILAIDPDSLEYGPRKKPRFPILEELKSIDDAADRIGRLVWSKDKAGKFAWDILTTPLVYAANRIPDVAESIVAVDKAIKWGFGWEIGPFEIWDAIGVEKSLNRLADEGIELPGGIKALADSGTPQFYPEIDGVKHYWDPVAHIHKPVKADPRVIILSDIKKSSKILYSNAEASIVDLGDGVACLEFHSKMNAIGSGILNGIGVADREAGKSFDALVIGNQGENFSVGANLMLLLFEALEGNVEEIDLMVRAFQRALMQLKYMQAPVVAAPFGRVLGGGAEVCLHSHMIQAGHETYMGLVEVGVGLLPAGGGSKEMVLRNMANAPSDADPMNFIKKAFETIGMAKVSFSAREAFDLGFFRRGDRVTMNHDHLISEAKKSALNLLETGWQPRTEMEKVKVLGRDGIGNIEMMLHNMVEGGFVSEHDAVVGRAVGRVLCGGEVDPGMVVDEQWLLDLERRGFVELISTRKTMERIRHTLKTGKPLRN